MWICPKISRRITAKEDVLLPKFLPWLELIFILLVGHNQQINLCVQVVDAKCSGLVVQPTWLFCTSCIQSWPTLPSTALCLFPVGQPTENSDVWKSLGPWPVSSTGQNRRKHHQWAKEVLETEWKPGSEKVFFPLNSQRLLDYHTRRLLGVPWKFYITLNSSHRFSQEGRESPQRSPENIKSPPAAGKFRTHDQSLFPWKR